jgi:hypothetical protein
MQDKGIKMFPGVEPPTEEQNSGQLKDGDISAFMQLSPKWSKEGLLEHIIELVVVEDKVCITVLVLLID